ncbi:hypothetical protein [Vibrio cincinnatiensis]|uniref:Uncharacterized protein n=1 Tax=Vibrio cincinnatiensis DSM 19608 TaxID=1123491 RepID=A0A1T4M9N6_VIBCI|nr:hypothetical protein SAMN02745782_00868 [Vibrio cincinnatiensis DSM 19608]SUP48086.1 Uncharacterised protein [Vibrio cincinnatiensis]
MNSVSTEIPAHYSPSMMTPSSTLKNPDVVEHDAPPLKSEGTKVTLSEEGRALLAALNELDQESQAEQLKSKTVGDKVEAFTHGALGMDHPKKPKQPADTSYTAGKYLSAAAKVGGLLLLLA